MPEILWVYETALIRDLLGPGLRLVIWLSGCNFRCKGCIDPSQWDREAGSPVQVKDLLESYRHLFDSLDGVTFSGGEPLLQSEAILDFLVLLPPDLDRMLFTGYCLHELDGNQLQVRSMMDISVEGRYIEELAGDFLWRGSANKKIFSPSGKYSDPLIQRWMKMNSAGISIAIRGQEVSFYGIPKKGTLEHLNRELFRRGLSLEENTGFWNTV